MFFPSGEIRLLERTCSGTKAVFWCSPCKCYTSESRWGNQRQNISVLFTSEAAAPLVALSILIPLNPEAASLFMCLWRQDWDLWFRFLPNRHQEPCSPVLSALFPPTCLHLRFRKTKNSIRKVGFKHWKVSVAPSCVFKPSPAGSLDVNTQVAPIYWSSQPRLPLRPGAIELCMPLTISSCSVSEVNRGAELSAPQTKPNQTSSTDIGMWHDWLFPWSRKICCQGLNSVWKECCFISEPEISDKTEHELSERRELFVFFSQTCSDIAFLSAN